MGKKSRPRKAGGLKSTILDISICDLVDQLWRLLQESPGDQLRVLWEEYDKMQTLIVKIKSLQGSNTPTLFPDRISALPKFEKWLQKHNALYEGVEIVTVPNIGLGLRARKEWKRDEKALVIPRELMMTSQTAVEGPLGALISQDQIIQSMSNVTLSLHLLNEKYAADSFWKPYIDVLPHSFTLPLYFSKEDLMLLQGSPCLVKSLLQIRNITKLYCHLHKIIRATSEISLPLFKCGFLYNDFIWAVSCVMSRQNEIPSKVHHSSPTLALIPLWDLCNHSSGHISTFFNVESQTCDCYAQHDFSVGENFTIFYGSRTNSELLVQQGFVYTENDFDSYPIRLGLSSGEEAGTRTLRCKVLDILNIPISGTFLITKHKESPLSPELSAFVRIFTASKDFLESILAMDKESQRIAANKLKDTNWSPGDAKASEFLEKRCSLLLRQYATTVAEDERLASDPSLSVCGTQAVNLRKCEKILLLNTIEHTKNIFSSNNSQTDTLTI